MSLLIASVQGEVPSNMDGADMFELRIDAMSTEDAIEQIPSLLASSPIPTILTCRSMQEGGLFDGDEEDRIDMYRAALECANPPRYIDVEYKALLQQPTLLDELPLGDTGVILSWHDTSSRPRDLLKRVAAMQEVEGIAVVKIVWRARSIRDNLEAFSILQTRKKPMIAICMGDDGLMSRILAPKFGGFATYASLEGCLATAAGQLTVQALQSIFHFRSITKETAVYGVIGNNVEHSASPAFHNAAFEAAGVDAVYLPLSIPEGWEHLKASVLELTNFESLNFRGVSVTIPHKEDMLKLVQESDGSVDDLCTTLGATNTVAFQEGTMSATNTDVQALASLAPNAKQVLILGAGGVARAAITAMQSIRAVAHIAARNNEQAVTLANEFNCSVVAETDKYDTIINCTPVGMTGGNDPDGDPLQALAPHVELGSSMTVLDTVYKPEETQLLQRAAKLGCKTISGVEMFRLQAKAQQRVWRRI